MHLPFRLVFLKSGKIRSKSAELEAEVRSGAFAECKSKQRSQWNTVGKTHAQRLSPSTRKSVLSFQYRILVGENHRGTMGSCPAHEQVPRKRQLRDATREDMSRLLFSRKLNLSFNWVMEPVPVGGKRITHCFVFFFFKTYDLI